MALAWITDRTSRQAWVAGPSSVATLLVASLAEQAAKRTVATSSAKAACFLTEEGSTSLRTRLRLRRGAGLPCLWTHSSAVSGLRTGYGVGYRERMLFLSGRPCFRDCRHSKRGPMGSEDNTRQRLLTHGAFGLRLRPERLFASPSVPLRPERLARASLRGKERG